MVKHCVFSSNHFFVCLANLVPIYNIFTGYINHNWKKEYRMSLVPHDNLFVHTSLSFDQTLANIRGMSPGFAAHNNGCAFVFQKMWGVSHCHVEGPD